MTIKEKHIKEGIFIPSSFLSFARFSNTFISIIKEGGYKTLKNLLDNGLQVNDNTFTIKLGNELNIEYSTILSKGKNKGIVKCYIEGKVKYFSIIKKIEFYYDPHFRFLIRDINEFVKKNKKKYIVCRN